MLEVCEGMGTEDHQYRWTGGVRQWRRKAAGPGYIKSMVNKIYQGVAPGLADGRFPSKEL